MRAFYDRAPAHCPLCAAEGKPAIPARPCRHMKCVARVHPVGKAPRSCALPPTAIVAGRPLCARHAKVARRRAPPCP